MVDTLVWGRDAEHYLGEPTRFPEVFWSTTQENPNVYDHAAADGQSR